MAGKLESPAIEQRQESTLSSPADENGRLLLLATAVASVLTCALIAGPLRVFFNDAMHRLGPGTDFFAYLTAGREFLAGNGLYGHGPGFGFRYHPLFAAVIGVALGRCPEWLALGAWVVVQAGAWASILLLLRRVIPVRPTRRRLTLLVVLFSPVYVELFMGNANLPTAALMLWAIVMLVAGRTRAAWLLLAAATVVKPVAAILVPIWILRRRTRDAVAAVGLAALAAVPFFVFNHEQLKLFLAINLQPIPARGWLVHAGNQGFHNLLVNLVAASSGLPLGSLSGYAEFPPWAAWFLRLWPVAMGVIGLGLMWRQRGSVAAMATVGVMVYLVGYKDVWEHSYVLLLVAGIGWAIDRTPLPPWLWVVLVWEALPTPFVLYDLDLPNGPFDPNPYWTFTVSLLHHGWRSLPVFAALCGWIVMAWNQREFGLRRPAPPQSGGVQQA